VIVVSDTNILSSFAAANALPILLRLFVRTEICIPPAVLEEIQVAIKNEKTYLNDILKAITDQQIILLPLTIDEIQALALLPNRLNAGERQAIVLVEQRKGVLISNDKRAVRYCVQHGIRAIELVDALRLLWIRQILSQNEVKQLLERMVLVEHLTLTAEQRAIIFAPHRKRK